MQAPQATKEVRLPRAVMRMSKAIEARLKVGEVTEEPVAGATTEAETPPVDAATTPSQTPTTPPAKPADPRHSDPEYWKHRFEIMHGKLMQERDLHKAEIDGLETRIADLETAVSTKEQEISSLKASPPPSSSKIDLGQFLTPEEIERIGEDEATTLISAAQKAVEAKLATMLPPASPPAAPAVQSKPANRETREAERQERQAKQEFLDALLELVPDYQTIDNSPGWMAWLAEKKGPRGKERQDVLNVHLRVGDADAVAAMFEQYRAESAPPPAPITAHAEGGQQSDTPPSRSSALLPPTEKEIRDYYKRAAIGKVSDAERTTFEARLKQRAATRQ